MRAHAAGGRGSLRGAQVIVTRAEGPDGPLGRLFAERGAKVLRWPALTFAPPRDPEPLERALARLSSYDWVVFTSPRAVAAVCERIGPPGASPRVAAIGSSTARALAEEDWPVDLVPSSAHGEALASEIGCAAGRGAKVLFPASSLARDAVPDGLEALGMEVDRVVAYRTTPRPLDPDECLAAVDRAATAVVTFTSPSAVDGLLSAFGRLQLERLLATCPAVVIGPTTARALDGLGLGAASTAEPSTLPGLVAAVERLVRDGKDG